MGKWQDIVNVIRGKKQINNKYNEVSFLGLNGYTNNDDTDLTKYLENGYNINGDVFSIINQKSSKLVSIPFYIKDIKDTDSYKKLNKLLKVTNYNPNLSQEIKANRLELKAFAELDFPMPFDKPNPNQDWIEFFKLTQTYLDLTGNIYWYKLMPENGINAGEPVQVYCLPSHLMTIHLKKDANLLGVENPIDYYELETYNKLVKFKVDEVVHVSIDNPNYGFNGEQLYGQSRLRAVYRNIVASNKSIDLNNEMLRNAGVFGFIHSKGTSFSEPQGKAIKDRILEAKSSKEELSNIMGASVDMGFTRISLTTDELKMFDNLKYNQKQICNALGWSDTLLNNDDGGKHDKQTTELKRVLINSIIPDAKIIEKAFNEGIIGCIKKYKGKSLVFDYKELPELQDDLETKSKWVISVVREGMMTRREGRHSLRLPEVEDKNLDLFTVNEDIMTLEDAILPQDDIIT